MSRRQLLRRALGAIGLALFPKGAARADGSKEGTGAPALKPLEVPHGHWKTLVSAEAYAVLFEEDTERPRSSALEHEQRSGSYLCAACFLPLFDSSAKFDSGTGWPSFFRAIEGHIGTRRDFKLLLPRTEYHCARCGGHQGHVFDDGPPPTGLRYCNNGVALRFVPQGEPLPELRS